MKNENKIFVKNNLTLEKKNSIFDIGIDVKAISVNIIGEKYIDNTYFSVDYIEYDTGIFLDSIKRNSLEKEEQIYTLVYARSSISKKNLYLHNGVGLIDPNYRDSIKLRFAYKAQPKNYKIIGDSLAIQIDESKIYKIGDKIGQLVFVKSFPIHFEYVPELIPSDRGGGFGSTGI